MLKLSNRGLGLLNAQYRSVLKKCFMLNLAAAFVAVATPAYSEGVSINANGGGGGTAVQQALANLTENMSNKIGDTTGSTPSAINVLYVNKSFTENLAGEGGAWIKSYKGIWFGYEQNQYNELERLSEKIQIANKQNTSGDGIGASGGAVVNGNENINSSNVPVDDALIKVYNTEFNNNSVIPGNNLAGGGAIVNYSANPYNAIESSVFKGNYALGTKGSQGGAIYNVATLAFQNGHTPRGYLSSSESTYNQNIAGTNNGTTSTNSGGGAIYNEGDFVSQKDTYTGNQALASDKAQGGAVYNQGTFTSTSDSYQSNQASANTTAQGGAIYNIGTLTLEDTGFSSNQASVVGSGDEITANGGAVYNDAGGNITMTNLTGKGIFSGNQVGSSGLSSGGAISNSGVITSTNIEFRSNKLDPSTNNVNAYGGAVHNGGKYNSSGEIYSANSVEGTQTAKGGAIYNVGGTETLFNITDGATFTNNYAQSNVAKGGAIYNNSKLVAEVAVETDDSYKLQFVGNYVIGGRLNTSIGMGGAIQNEGNMQLSGAFFDGNNVFGTIAAGGAVSVYNEQTSSIKNSKFDSNYITLVNSTQEDKTPVGYGGAISNIAYNGEVALSIDNTSFIDNYITTDVEGAQMYGGAISNSSAWLDKTGNNRIEFVVNAMDVEFTNNGLFENPKEDNADYTDSYGGAIYNGDNSTFIANIVNGYDLTFNVNQAKNGGAIYNDSNIVPNTTDSFTINSNNNSDVKFIGNIATAIGGAIYNNGKIEFENKGTGETKFSANQAQKGGAIYNSGEFNINTTSKGEYTFSGNKANKGGAIYNTADMSFIFQNGGNLTFATTSDDVYNTSSLSIYGNAEDRMNIYLNSTFAGNGTYNLDYTNLYIGSTGYIDYEPVLKFVDMDMVYLAQNAYLNLDDGDTTENLDINIAKGAKLNYKSSTDVTHTLAKNVENSGLINLEDGKLTTVIINSLVSQNGTIRIDVDNSQNQADIIKISNNISGTTNVAFANADSLRLEVGERIKFAETIKTIPTDNFEFTSRINNGLYEIGIGHEETQKNNDWYFYRTQYYNPEVIAYIDLSRSAVEQARSQLFNVERINRGDCDCYMDGDTYRICNFKDLGPKSRVWATPFYRSGTFDEPVETDLTLWGVDFGFDHQFDLSSQLGLFASYRDGTYENDGKGKGDFYSTQGSELNITSIIAGLYYRQYFGDFYMAGTAFGGQQSADIKADNGVNSSTDGLNFGAKAEMGYDIRVGKRSVLTPAFEATYNYIKYDDVKDNSGKEVEFDTINDIELEAGIKYEYQFNNEYQRLTTAYIKPSVVQIISNGGAVTINGNEVDDTLENDTFGRVEVGADAELTDNISVGAFGNYTFGSSYNAWSVGGNLRYIW